MLYACGRESVGVASNAMLSTSLTLLTRLRSQADQVAWERFVDLYTPLLFAWARKAGMAESDAGDLVQDVFLKLTAELPRFTYDSQRKNFRGWLKTITINACRDRQRRPLAVIGDSALQNLADDPLLEQLWEQEYQKQLVAQALRIMQTDFEPTTWKACWETTVNARPAKEVGAELGLSESAVFMAKSRVLRRLREELKELLE